MKDEIKPLGDEEEFGALLSEMVADQAPRIFAVVQEYGERIDGRITAWGMAFDEHAAVVDVRGTSSSVPSRRRASLRRFQVGREVTPRVVWVEQK